MARKNNMQGSAYGKTLLIAPKSNLQNVDREIQAVANALKPDLLFGEVTLTGALEKLSASNYGIVWFACHGTPEGVILSDGLLDTSRIVQMLRGNPPKVVVLNTCSSIQVAMQVHDELGAAVICTVNNIPDIDAYVTGARLASELGMGSEIADAYHASRPGYNVQYVLLNGSIVLNGKDEFQDTHRLMLEISRDLHREMGAISARQEEQARAISEFMTRVSERMDSNKEQYHILLDKGRLVSWALGFALFTTAVFLVTDEVQNYLGLRWVTGLLFSAVFAAISFALFVYGIGFRLDK